MSRPRCRFCDGTHERQYMNDKNEIYEEPCDKCDNAGYELPVHSRRYSVELSKQAIDRAEAAIKKLDKFKAGK